MPITPAELDAIKRAAAVPLTAARHEIPSGLALAVLEAIDRGAAPSLTEDRDPWTGRRVSLLGGKVEGYVVRTHRDAEDAEPHTLAVQLDGGGEMLVSPRAAKVEP